MIKMQYMYLWKRIKDIWLIVTNIDLKNLKKTQNHQTELSQIANGINQYLKCV